MELSLVVLAAGIGSRYGGLKQLDPVGPGGTSILEYSVFDAKRTGFTRVVLVIREGMEDAVRRAVGDRLARHIGLRYAVQDRALPPGFTPPPGRTKPWGTGHATLAAAAHLTGPFAVINADDFYGPASYRILAQYLSGAKRRPGLDLALVSFSLGETLSPDGPVSRAVCDVDAEGWLRSIRELVHIEREDDRVLYRDESGGRQPVPTDTPVSLNFWGFTPDFLPHLEKSFRRFLQKQGASEKAELYLPVPVQELIDSGEARVRVLGGGGPWGGLTYPGDRPRLAAMLETLVARGEYPRNPFP